MTSGETAGSTGQYLYAAKDLRKETRGLPLPADDEVQIAVRSTTLCGSDLHYYSHYRNGSIIVKEPLCLGHESAGEIVAVGSKVSQSRPELERRTRVALEVGVPCDDCTWCNSQQYHICPLLRFRGSGSKFPHYQGCLQERVNHPAKWLHVLPADLDCDVGALLEPLSVAVHAVNRSKITCSESSFSGSSVIIYGAGAIGLLCSLTAQAAGFKHITMIDIDQGRLDFATSEGFATATYLVRPKPTNSLDEKLAVAREITTDVGALEHTDGFLTRKAPIVFECTGVESSIQSAIYAAASGGCVVLAGLGVPNHTLPISEASSREITLLTTWRYANAYPKAIEIAQASVTGTPINGRKLPDIRKMITHRFHGLDSVNAAFQTAAKPKDKEGKLVVKAVVRF